MYTASTSHILSILYLLCYLQPLIVFAKFHKSGITNIKNYGINHHRSIEDKQCPQKDDIKPCICSKSGGGLDAQIDIDCSFIESNEELQRIFTADFPTKRLNKFSLRNSNKVTKLISGVFQSISFEIIEIEQEDAFGLIEPLALTGSIFTLQHLRVVYTRISENTFPFSMIGEFRNLKILELYGNYITSIPKIESFSLEELSLNDNRITTIPSNTFNMVPFLQYLYISGNAINYIIPGKYIKTVFEFIFFIEMIAINNMILHQRYKILFINHTLQAHLLHYTIFHI